MKLNMKFLKTKSVRYGGYATLVTILVLAGIIIVNLIMQNIPAQIDMTENKLYSLSEQTLKVLKELNTEVNIYALYKTGNKTPDVETVLEKYAHASSKVKLSYIDPDLNPTFATKYDKEGKGLQEGSIIVESGKVFRVIKPYDLYNISYDQQGQPQLMGYSTEQKLTSAILYVGTGYTPVVYELSGHNEDSLTALGISTALDDENFSLKAVNLLTQDMPSDAAVLVVNSPKFDISQAEADKVLAYLEQGGRAIFLFDFTEKPIPIFESILGIYGLALEKGIAIEGDKNHVAGNPLLLAPDIQSHEITDPLTASNLNIIVPYSMGVVESERTMRTVEVKPLLATSKNSWLRTNFANNQMTLQPGDKPGPVTIAWASSKKKLEMNEKEGFRIVVVGSGQLLKPVSLFGTVKANVDFFMNSLAWLNGREDSISVRSKSIYKLPLSMNALQVYLFAFIFVILIPLALLGVGLGIWLKRRHL